VNVSTVRAHRILDEHPEWSARLIAELEHRRLPFEKIDHSNHGFDPRDSVARYSVIVNRTSPSSHRRGHGGVLFYAEALLAHWESLGCRSSIPFAPIVREIQGCSSSVLFERLGIHYPRTVVVNHRDQVLKASAELRFRSSSSRTSAARARSSSDSKPRADSRRGRPRSTSTPERNGAGAGSFIESQDGAIVRVEVLDDRIRHVRDPHRPPASDFNLCRPDILSGVAPYARSSTDLGACPVGRPEAGAPGDARYDARRPWSTRPGPRARSVDRRRRNRIPRRRGRRPASISTTVNATSNSSPTPGGARVRPVSAVRGLTIVAWRPGQEDRA